MTTHLYFNASKRSRVRANITETTYIDQLSSMEPVQPDWHSNDYFLLPSDDQTPPYLCMGIYPYTRHKPSPASTFNPHMYIALTPLSISIPLQIILELSATGDATYLTQHHQLYIDDYFYINCTNTVPRPSPTPLFLLD